MYTSYHSKFEAGTEITGFAHAGDIKIEIHTVFTVAETILAN